MNQQQLEIISLALRLAGDAPMNVPMNVPVAHQCIADPFIGAYCIVRSARTGDFAETLASRNGKEESMTNARRI